MTSELPLHERDMLRIDADLSLFSAFTKHQMFRFDALIHCFGVFQDLSGLPGGPVQVLVGLQPTSPAARWKDELVQMAHCSLSRDETIQHLLPEWSFHDSTVMWHTEFLENLLQCRAMSLASAFCLPPMRYCHVLSGKGQESQAAQAVAVREFKALLAAESASHTTVVGPLKCMAWRLSPFNRAVFLAHEEDVHRGTSHAKALHLVHTKCLGDSRIIENLHQHGRDLQRSAKK